MGSQNYAGIVADNTVGSVVEHCYADLAMCNEHQANLFGGDAGETGNCAAFVPDENGGLLQAEVTVGNQNTDRLLTALNLWVGEQDQPFVFRTWELGPKQLPTFGKMFTAVNENQAAAAMVRVFPNPASETLNVEGVEAVEMRMYDVFGRLVQTAKGNTMRIEDHANGLYLLNVRTDDGTLYQLSVVIKK